MKGKATFLICWVLLLAVSIFGKPPQSADFPKGISLTLDRHPGWLGQAEEGSDLTIRCTFRNEGKVPITFLLADHNDYNGTLPYPMRLMAKVTAKDGEVLTRTATFGDWWTSYFDESGCRCPEMPGDRITLKPREKVVRIVPLAVVLRGLDSLRGGLKAGDYAVELKLGDIISNRMKLAVVAKE